MSGTLSKSKQFGVDSVNSLAVTELKEDVFSFRWDIRNFKKRLENKKPEAELRSPSFDCYVENNKLEWQLRVCWNKKEKRPDSDQEDQLLSIYLHLKNAKETILAHFQIDLLNADKYWKKMSAVAEFSSSPASGLGWPNFLKIADLVNPIYKLLEDDTLKVHCRIIMKHDTVYQVRGVKTEAEEEAARQKHDLVSDYTNLFNSRTLSDVLIKTKETTFKAHKIVLACRSPVFSAMFQNEMPEAINNIVEILDFDDVVVQGMLQYIYCGELTLKILKDNSVELFQIADKYDIKGLKKQAAEVLAVNLSVVNVVDTLILADTYNASNLKKTSIGYIKMNKAKLEKNEGFQKLKKYKPSIFIDLYYGH